MMMPLRKQSLSIYADKSSQQWIVRDSEGRFWVVAPGEHAWDQRRQFEPTPESDLEPVPGHYKYLLNLPF